MSIEMRKLSDSNPYVDNPRPISAPSDAVAASIREFGFMVWIRAISVTWPSGQ
jgi:hypothetical protein